MNKILVTGSRDWNDRHRMAHAIIQHLHPEDVLVHGAAAGADRMARSIFLALGHTDLPYPANWKERGRAAGVLRNLEMLETLEVGVDKVLAFVNPCFQEKCSRPDTHWSHGARHCVEAAQRKGHYPLIYLHPSLEHHIPTGAST